MSCRSCFNGFLVGLFSSQALFSFGQKVEKITLSARYHWDDPWSNEDKLLYGGEANQVIFRAKDSNYFICDSIYSNKFEASSNSEKVLNEEFKEKSRKKKIKFEYGKVPLGFNKLKDSSDSIKFLDVIHTSHVFKRYFLELELIDDTISVMFNLLEKNRIQWFVYQNPGYHRIKDSELNLALTNFVKEILPKKFLFRKEYMKRVKNVSLSVEMPNF